MLDCRKDAVHERGTACKRTCTTPRRTPDARRNNHELSPCTCASPLVGPWLLNCSQKGWGMACATPRCEPNIAMTTILMRILMRSGSGLSYSSCFALADSYHWCHRIFTCHALKYNSDCYASMSLMILQTAHAAAAQANHELASTSHGSIACQTMESICPTSQNLTILISQSLFQ